MFSLEDLDKDLLVCQIYCVWICFGSVCALSPNCTGSLAVFLSSGSELSGNLRRPGAIQTSLIPTEQMSLIFQNWIFSPLPSMSAALIFPWIGFRFSVYNYTEKRKEKRGIAVTSHMRKLQRSHCGLAAASCGAVYRAPHSTFAGWVSALCHSHIHYLWWGPVMFLIISQRLLMVPVWTP